MPTSNVQYVDSSAAAAAAAAAAAVDMTTTTNGDDGGGGEDSLDDLVMMAPSAVAEATATTTTTAVAVGGKRKHDDIMTDAAVEETTTHHHQQLHHHHDVAPIATTTTTTNDPMLLGTTAVAHHEDTFPALPPPVPEAPTTTNAETTTTLLPPPPQEVVHHHHQMPLTTTAAVAPPPHLLIRPSPEGLPDKPKSKRINWGKSPHKERLTQILSDWFSKSGACIDESTGQPIGDYRVYASKVGISRTTLFKYIHKDPSKRRLVREDEGSGTRGKKRLMSEEEVRAVVRELKEGKDDSTPPSRNEAVDLIVKRFGLSRQAASRQLTRHVMPMFHEGIYLASGEHTAEDDGGGKVPAAAVAAQVVEGVSNNMMETVGVNEDTAATVSSIHQTKRSIVISGVTSGLGRALLGYFYNHGHTVAGCGRRGDEILVLQGQYPNAKLSVVDVSNDKSVQLWADSICGGDGMEEDARSNNVDLVIANAGVSPETLYQTKTAWEVPRQDFDDTLDVNIKGVSNMIRHFVPRMVKNNVGTFVAMSSGLGRSPNPHQVAYCASKWAVEGMVKSLAMSLPHDSPMCAVPLAPGVVQTGGADGKNEGSSSSSNGNIDKWIEVAGPMILGLSRKDNGKSLSVKGFYSVRYRQSWSFQDGSGIPDRVGHMFGV